jgi:CubicO group peptidase (beta-lactamase class C family)
VAVRAVHLDGVVAPGFEPVAAEFARNFDERGELGAAFAAFVGSEPVVDLWGGVADARRRRAWERDTLQLVFSGTKGLVAICLLMLVERGRLSLDAEVCRYWPEFAENGKAEITVAELVSHRARLPAIDAAIALPELIDDERIAGLLARQPPATDPRARHVYHGLTFGWLCGELIRRVAGCSVGRFFAREVAGPLGLDVWIGLPVEEERRVSRIELAADWSTDASVRAAAADELLQAVWANPPIWERATFPWNDPAFHAAEIPGANAIGTPRALAKLYAGLEQILSEETLALGRTELERRVEPLLNEPQAFGVGFQLQTEIKQLGPPVDAFGHGGAGGSVHGAWPTQRVGFSYAMNLMRDDHGGADPRAQALLDALHRCVDDRCTAAVGGGDGATT